MARAGSTDAPRAAPVRASRTLWRVFPWKRGVASGAPYSPDHLPEQSGQGRFDLPLSADASSWYLAESGEHAVAEKLQDLRNGELHEEFLTERGQPLALASVVVDAGPALADLCDPAVLRERGIAPDRLAYRDRSVTQAIAERLHADADLAGFRWWSSLMGEWHTVILFSDRLPETALTFQPPTALTLSTPALLAATSALAIELP